MIQAFKIIGKGLALIPKNIQTRPYYKRLLNIEGYYLGIIKVVPYIDKNNNHTGKIGALFFLSPLK